MEWEVLFFYNRRFKFGDVDVQKNGYEHIFIEMNMHNVLLEDMLSESSAAVSETQDDHESACIHQNNSLKLIH